MGFCGSVIDERYLKRRTDRLRGSQSFKTVKKGDESTVEPAIPEVKGPTNFIYYRWIFVTANIENQKK